MSEGPSRVAVVTGGASGIGRCVVQELAHRGWRVASLDLAPSEADLAFEVDMRDAEAVSEAVSQVEARLGPVDAAVSVAGHYEMLPFSDITLEAWERMLQVHLGGLRNLLTATLPGMLGRRSGSIVATASELAVGGGGPGDAHYAAAKGAVLGLVRSLAPEVADQGVRVNAVAPGPTDTPLLAADS
ncbi:MAG: SDR family NAD(P)-dependent oxidoreductase, partial [Pedococcus sp.]